MGDITLVEVRGSDVQNEAQENGTTKPVSPGEQVTNEKEQRGAVWPSVLLYI